MGKTLQLPHMLMAKSELCPLHSQGLDPRRITGIQGGGVFHTPVAVHIRSPSLWGQRESPG